jgi:GntR family transcriptional regulator
MAMLLKVNANTMQRVYQEMERADLISSKRGTGYFFTEDKDMMEKISIGMAGEAIARFLEEMRALGFTDKQIMTELSNCMEGGERNGVAASESR